MTRWPALVAAGLLLLAAAGLAPAQAASAAAGDWVATVYGGLATTGDMGETLVGRAPLAESYLLAGSLARTSRRWGNVSLEYEGFLARHTGDQTFWEGVATAGLRHDALPWSQRFPSSVAVTSGLSLASRRPRIERNRHNDGTEALLHHLGLEAAFDPWPASPARFALRLHHRSGAWGLYGTSGGSNYYALALRYRL